MSAANPKKADTRLREQRERRLRDLGEKLLRLANSVHKAVDPANPGSEDYKLAAAYLILTIARELQAKGGDVLASQSRQDRAWVLLEDARRFNAAILGETAATP